MDKYKTKMTIKKWFSFINLEKLSGKSQKTIQSFDAYVKKLTFERTLNDSFYSQLMMKQTVYAI